MTVAPHWLRKTDWAEYWDGPFGWYSPHRQALVAELRRLPPFRSVLEVGCGALVNLALIREAFPDAHLVGFDPSEEAMQYGLQRWQREERGALPDVYEGALPGALGGDERFDVVISLYSLCYIEPRFIVSCLDALGQATTKALIIGEPMVVPSDGAKCQPHLLREHPHTWRYGYLRWFQEHEKDWLVRYVPETPIRYQVQDLNLMLTARKR